MGYMWLSSAGLQAQPIISNAEDFSIGTVLRFQQCVPEGVAAGNAGTNQVWDFSMLTHLPDTTVETMADPSQTPSGSAFPEANLAEAYSDGRFVYVDKQTDANYLVGFADINSGLMMHYPNAMQFAARPIMYETFITDDFTNNYTVSNLNFSGAGSITIHADGYGTLILPNGTHENVLRLKIEQSRIDTLLEFQTISASSTVTYAWFDGIQTSSLLKIDSTYSESFTEKSVEYLIDETITGLQTLQESMDFEIHPNPATDRIGVTVGVKGKMTVSNINGKSMMVRELKAGNNEIDIKPLSAGQYFVNFESRQNRITRKLIVSETR